MTRKPLILSITLALCTLPANAVNYWKHKQTQGNVGACHTFATVALVEAEYWKTTGKHINLSERELFVRHVTRGYTSTEAMLQKQLELSTESLLPSFYKESGFISKDFQLLKKHGVASEKELPYSPLFSSGVSATFSQIRHQRDALTREARQLKSTKQWNQRVKQERISSYHSKINKSSTRKVLTVKENGKTHREIKNFLGNYDLRKVVASSANKTKQQIIAQLKYRPVAVDIAGLHKLYPSASKTAAALHGRHSLVISGYDASKNQFIVRNSNGTINTGGSNRIQADALSKKVYHYYYLHRSNQG